MKVRVTMAFDTRDRQAIRNRTHDDRKPATREQVINWIATVIDAQMDDLHYDLDQSEEDAKEGNR